MLKVIVIVVAAILAAQLFGSEPVGGPDQCDPRAQVCEVSGSSSEPVQGSQPEVTPGPNSAPYVTPVKPPDDSRPASGLR